MAGYLPSLRAGGFPSRPEKIGAHISRTASDAKEKCPLMRHAGAERTFFPAKGRSIFPGKGRRLPFFWQGGNSASVASREKTTIATPSIRRSPKVLPVMQANIMPGSFFRPAEAEHRGRAVDRWPEGRYASIGTAGTAGRGVRCPGCGRLHAHCGGSGMRWCALVLRPSFLPQGRRLSGWVRGRM